MLRFPSDDSSYNPSGWLVSTELEGRCRPRQPSGGGRFWADLTIRTALIVDEDQLASSQACVDTSSAASPSALVSVSWKTGLLQQRQYCPPTLGSGSGGGSGVKPCLPCSIGFLLQLQPGPELFFERLNSLLTAVFYVTVPS